MNRNSLLLTVNVSDFAFVTFFPLGITLLMHLAPLLTVTTYRGSEGGKMSRAPLAEMNSHASVYLVMYDLSVAFLVLQNVPVLVLLLT